MNKLTTVPVRVPDAKADHGTVPNTLSSRLEALACCYHRRASLRSLASKFTGTSRQSMQTAQNGLLLLFRGREASLAHHVVRQRLVTQKFFKPLDKRHPPRVLSIDQVGAEDRVDGTFRDVGTEIRL